MAFDKLLSIYVSNGLGILLLITLHYSNKSRSVGKKERQAILALVCIAILACAADPIVYAVDGMPGLWVTAVIHIGNTWLYLANILTGRIWVQFISEHLSIPINRKHRIALDMLVYGGMLCLLANLRFPIIYKVENNVYTRTYLFWLFVCISLVYMIDSLLLYFEARQRGGILKFFPIGAFVIPSIIGIVVQSVAYGVSVVWPCVAIGIAGATTALKNEVIFRDRLTGLYNRSYLDLLREEIYGKNGGYYTGVMIDLNGFKRINDQFGHAAGDEALIIASDIMSRTVGNQGTVIRYAGDEFVVLLNTVEENLVQDTIKKLHQAFNEFNMSKAKPYQLSASMGYSALDVQNQSMNDFMNAIDLRMYEEKAKYYRQNGAERDRRNRRN